jgi:hypothetical protein
VFQQQLLYFAAVEVAESQRLRLDIERTAAGDDAFSLDAWMR